MSRSDRSVSEKQLDELSWKLARQCRHIIQTCLREEEWIDADHEFYLTIRAEIYRLMGKK